MRSGGRRHAATRALAYPFRDRVVRRRRRPEHPAAALARLLAHRGFSGVAALGGHLGRSGRRSETLQRWSKVGRALRRAARQHDGAEQRRRQQRYPREGSHGRRAGVEGPTTRPGGRLFHLMGLQTKGVQGRTQNHSSAAGGPRDPVTGRTRDGGGQEVSRPPAGHAADVHTDEECVDARARTRELAPL